MQFTKSIMSLALVGPALILGSALPAAIQQRSFIASCSIANFDPPFLSTVCQSENGANIASSVNLNNCIGDFNGDLVNGSTDFTSACNSFSVSGTVLTASCGDEAGNFQTSSFDVNNILTNNNGVLSGC